MKSVLVAVDGSEPSLKAARFAAELARPHGAELALTCVVTPNPYPEEFYGLGAIDLERAERSGQEVLAQAEAALQSIGVRTRRQVLFGAPAETLADAAESGDFDLVVVGSRGKGAVARVLLGSVSQRLVHICRRPVLVVH